jgi:UDP-N-acetylmuramate--alanine ligase
MKLPHDIGPVHFVGIGGIGMSGIAEVMVNLGYMVQGSDQSESANVKRLRDKGVKIAIGHAAENLTGVRVVVVSSAIKPDNPELVAARAERLPVVRRAEMLAELMRLKSCVAIAGTHGKTTTTSMVAALLDADGFDPTVINGGIINAYGTNARLGTGEWMVVEADESDGTFLKLPADVAIVTNIDPEHLDHFKTFEAVQDAFRAFVENWSAASRITAWSPTARTRRPTCGWSMSRTPAAARCSPSRSAIAPEIFCTRSRTSHYRCRDGITRSMPRRRSRWPMSSASATT